MSQQSLNVQQVVQIVRRYRVLVGALTVAGFLIGVIFSVLSPPLVTSTALVVSPGNVAANATEVVVVSSEPVLSHALPAIKPAVSLQTLEKKLKVRSPAPGILSISVQGQSAAAAEGIANAVADSYIAYVRGPESSVGHIAAKLLQPATTQTGMGALAQAALDGGLGALAGLVAGTVTAIIIRRRSRRLVVLDDIANSIGVPVLAAVSVDHPSEAADWARLLDDYEPGSVEAWRLRQALLEMGVIGPAAHNQDTVSVTVLSMAADPKALTLGPQLAAFAASLEISTLLVIGTQRDSNATAALYTACTVPGGSPRRSRYLRTVATGTADNAVSVAEKLVIVVTVAEGETPQVLETMPTAATVLAVSSGVATAEQLARLAMAASANGREVTGLFVADPELGDRTTGRFPRPARQGRRPPASGLPAAPATEPGPVLERGSGPASKRGSGPARKRGSAPVPEEDARPDLSGQRSAPTESRLND